MAGKRNVTIDVLVDDAKARAQLKGLGETATTSGASFSKMGALAKAGIAAVVGSQLVSFLGDATKAAIEDEKSQRMLALALENTHGAQEGQISSVERYIEKLSQASGVADDELRPALAELARTHGSVEEAQDALNVAMDIAAAKGLSLQTVTSAMGKASLGQVGALGRLGVATKNASGEMMTYDEVLREASRTMGGAMAESAETLEGQLRKAQNAWEEGKEAIGRFFAPALAMAGEEISETVQGLQDLDSVSAEFEGNEVLEWASAIRRGLQDIGAVERDVRSETARLSSAMDDARHSAQKQADAHEEAEDAIRGQIDASKELTNPLFALFQTSNRLREATQKYTEALIKNGPKSKQAQDAAIDLAKAQQDVNIAAETYSLDGGPQSVEALKKLLRQAGLSEAGIADLIRMIERLNRTPVGIPDRRNFGAGDDRDNRSEFHTGGVVGGTPGSEVNATLLAGETVIPRGGSAGGGDIHIHVAGSVLSERELVEVVKTAFMRDGKRGNSWLRTQGP